MLEAEQSVDKLCKLVDETLQSNQDLNDRVQRLESPPQYAPPGTDSRPTANPNQDLAGPNKSIVADDPTTATNGDENDAVSPPRPASMAFLFPHDNSEESTLDDKPSASTLRTQYSESSFSSSPPHKPTEAPSGSVDVTTVIAGTLPSVIEGHPLRFNPIEPNATSYHFEEDLLSSKVYSKLQRSANNPNRFSVISTRTTATNNTFRTAAHFSVHSTATTNTLGGRMSVSVADVRDLGGIPLPVGAGELSNGEWYVMGEKEVQQKRRERDRLERLERERALGGAGARSMNGGTGTRKTGVRKASAGSSSSADRPLLKKLFLGSSTEGTAAQGDELKRFVFGVPLSVVPSVAIAMRSTRSEQEITCGEIPIVVAKCGRYIKENSSTPNLFQTQGSTPRMKALRRLFETPPLHGAQLDWSQTNYTPHDAATTLLHFLDSLPSPVIPPTSYDAFVAPLRSAIDFTRQNWTSVQAKLCTLPATLSVTVYRDLIDALPKRNRAVFFYVFDLLCVLLDVAKRNKLEEGRLVMYFQPGLLSQPVRGGVGLQEDRLAQAVVSYLLRFKESVLEGCRRSMCGLGGAVMPVGGGEGAE